MTSIPQQQRKQSAESRQDLILCHCQRWRRGLMADHRDWCAEYLRDRAAESVPDENFFATFQPPAPEPPTEPLTRLVFRP